MKEEGIRIGVDVGGSHVTVALTDRSGGLKCRNRATLDSGDTAYNIVVAISDCLKEVLSGAKDIESVGIAFPGPFDYEKGVSAVMHVGGKFEQTFGLHIKQALKDLTGLRDVHFKFANDAHCFAAGAYRLLGLKSRRTIFLTLGTGLGSAFMADGQLLLQHPDIPLSGAFYDQPYNNGKADDYFSSRWILQAYKLATGADAASVKTIVEHGEPAAQEVMGQFGTNIGRFLRPWLLQFGCDELVIGGNIASAFNLFGPSLKKEIIGADKTINILLCENTEDCIVSGAAIIAGNDTFSNSHKTMRKTFQELLPARVSKKPVSAYNIYPSFPSGEKVFSGFDSLAAEMIKEKVVILDGYGGVLWENFREQLHTSLQAGNKQVFWYNIDACLKPAADIHAMIAVSLNGDDPVFGKRYTGELSDFFDPEKLRQIKPDPAAGISIIYGTGAALCGAEGKLFYVDVPKNEIQFRMRAGSIFNLGAEGPSDATQMYKRFYFVDWPVLNKHKAALLPRISGIIDEQRIQEITWMEGEAFRDTLHRMLQQPFRARPWFEPGVWGGNWMKEHIPGLSPEAVNYAWSFELITPENGIVIEGDGNLLEASFDFLLYASNEKLLGKVARRFGTEFPIRFDFLDTFNGSHLSIQCHPRPAYAKEHFGENFTQDETYYILDCKPDASVYLGFQDDIDPVAFEQALITAQETGVEMDIEKYVQRLPAHKHDLFLIPNGTVHASSVNNLVLEISSTPYIFTFKQYDWQRAGLDGRPRPINIEHALNNLHFDRKGNYVADKLISHPILEEEWTGGRKWQLPTHEEHFYTVERYEFTGTIRISTNGQCHVCMLVEGERITVSGGGSNTLFHFAETFVVPAATGHYDVTSEGNSPAFLVVAHVKESHC